MDAIATYSRLGGRIQTFSCRAAAWLREQRAASPMSEYGSLRPWVNANLWLWSIATAGVFRRSCENVQVFTIRGRQGRRRERQDSSSAWLWPASGAFHRSYENNRVFAKSPSSYDGRCAGQHSVRQRQAGAGFKQYQPAQGITLAFFQQLLYSKPDFSKSRRPVTSRASPTRDSGSRETDNKAQRRNTALKQAWRLQAPKPCDVKSPQAASSLELRFTSRWFFNQPSSS